MFLALSVQYGYAVSHGVNLLASDFNRPSEQFGGSGIYSHDGKILGNVISYTTKSEMIIADIPIIYKRTPPVKEKLPEESVSSSTKPPAPQKENDVEKFHTNMDDLSKYTFQNVVDAKHTKNEICNDDYCCKFDISKETTERPHPVYKYVVGC